MPLQKPENMPATKSWYGEMPTYNIYTLGIAGEKFFTALRDDGQLLGVSCDHCALTYLPPRVYCERCLSRTTSWVKVNGTGKIHTFCVSSYGLDGKCLVVPDVVALITFESIHGGIVHRIGEVEPEQVQIGMEVEMIMRPVSERKGSILDILYFRPV